MGKSDKKFNIVFVVGYIRKPVAREAPGGVEDQGRALQVRNGAGAVVQR